MSQTNQEYYDEEYLDGERDRFRPFVKLNSRLFQYWNSGKHPDYTPLPYFIEWALSKGFRPAWLDRAIEFGLIEVRRDGDRREWVIAKSKDGEDGEAHPFKLDVVELGTDEDGETASDSQYMRPRGCY